MTDALLQKLWYQRRGYKSALFALLLSPLSLLFFFLTTSRRFLYQCGLLRSFRIAEPVIVVGNLTVGGTGKTPFVLWLAEELRSHGLVPGVITRGYGGSSKTWPRDVEISSDPAVVGDEAVLLARAGGIVVAGPNRVASANRAVERGATVIVSDDGLQHYRLKRDIEIAVIDAERQFGNGWLLPAGPLRESPKRLNSVDVLVLNDRGSMDVRQPTEEGRRSNPPLIVNMTTSLGVVRSLSTNEIRRLESFSGQAVHAIAGIGNPGPFFDSLRAAGLTVDAHALRDHAAITAENIRFADPSAVLMTEKDAVKCVAFADSRCWSVSLDVGMDRGAEVMEAILRKVRGAKAVRGRVDDKRAPQRGET